MTPFDLGYGRIVKFDHDFLGRDALEAMGGSKRTNGTLVWDEEDVSRVQNSVFSDELPFKTMRWPTPSYGYQHRDAVAAPDGAVVGYSSICSFTIDERKILSLSIIDKAFATPGTRLEPVWGEPGGGSRKPQVESHRQTKIGVTVAPSPFPQAVRVLKRA